jgi:hypothetical protein
MKMSRFEYIALKSDGDEVQGVIEAESGEMAILYLLQKKLFPKEVKPLSRSAALTYKKLDHLQNLKARLETHMKKNEKKVEDQPKPDRSQYCVQEEESTPGWRVDLWYSLFLIGLAAVVVLALKYGL